MILKRSTPGRLGISPKAILAFLNALDENGLGAHSFMLLRHGMVASEGWWKPYSPDKTHMLFSLSKSFTSTAVGFCVQEGLLSIDDLALKYFDGVLEGEPCENMRRLKIRNLLTMGTGHDKEPNAFENENWAEGFLKSYIAKEPGSIFVYNTPATYMLSCIVQKVTGQKVVDYLKPRLFEPLGIEGISWEESPQGISTGGFGLNVKTEDIAKFATFLLNKGNIDDRQLINPEWIELATSKQISNGNPEEKSDWSQGYGFQFWRCQPKNVYRGDGAFGQYCVVMPDQDACLAMTSGSNNIGMILGLAWEHLLPAFGDECSDDGLDELNDKIKSLSIAPPEGLAASENANAFAGKYEFGDNGLNLKTLTFDFNGGMKVTPEFVKPANPWEHDTTGLNADMPALFGDWAQSGSGENTVCCAYAWQPDGKLCLKMAQVLTPFICTLVMEFVPNGVKVEYSRNVGFANRPLNLIGIKTA